jgi:hypothetical protein
MGDSEDLQPDHCPGPRPGAHAPPRALRPRWCGLGGARRPIRCSRARWQGTGTAPQPSAFVAGGNETHTNTPTSIVISPTAGGLMADGAVIQQPLAPVIPVMIFSPTGPYGTAAGAPAPITVANVAAAIAAFNGKISAAIQAKLMPTSAQIATYFPAGATPTTTETTLATNLACRSPAWSRNRAARLTPPG